MLDFNNNVRPVNVMDFMTKYPKPDLAFMEALSAGDISFTA
jgi:hypothetical protein